MFDSTFVVAFFFFEEMSWRRHVAELRQFAVHELTRVVEAQI